MAGVRYDDNDVVIMRRIIAMVDEMHGGGMPPDIAIGGMSRACSMRSCSTWQFVGDTRGCGDEGVSTPPGLWESPRGGPEQEPARDTLATCDAKRCRPVT